MTQLPQPRRWTALIGQPWSHLWSQNHLHRTTWIESAQGMVSQRKRGCYCQRKENEQPFIISTTQPLCWCIPNITTKTCLMKTTRPVLIPHRHATSSGRKISKRRDDCSPLQRISHVDTASASCPPPRCPPLRFSRLAVACQKGRISMHFDFC